MIYKNGSRIWKTEEWKPPYQKRKKKIKRILKYEDSLGEFRTISSVQIFTSYGVSEGEYRGKKTNRKLT